MIVYKVADQADLKILCEVSKSVSDVAMPRLYESIILQAGDDDNLDYLKGRLETMPQHKLHYTKHVRIKSPLRAHLGRRCLPHPGTDYESLQKDLDPDDDPFFELEFILDGFLHHLKEDELLSFSWDVGMCFPSNAFGTRGVLFKKQKRLENISLITDGSCRADTPGLIHLTEFKHLKSLSWLGLNKGYHHWSFSEFVKKNKPGNSDPSETDEEEKTEIVLFKSLNVLSLSAISFEGEEIRMAHAFNILKLTTLKLVNCHFCLPMLENLVEMDQIGWVWKDDGKSISSFLNSFSGLEDIFLMLTDEGWDLIFLTISNHAMTLERLVIHERTSNQYGGDLDSQVDLSSELENLLSKTSLICLGANISPWELESGLHSLAEKPALKILHLRSSGVDERTRKEIPLDELDSSSTSESIDGSIDPENESGSDSSEAAGEIETSQTEQVRATGSPPTMEGPMSRPLIDFKNVARARAIANGTFNEEEWSADLLPFAKWAFSEEGLPDLRILAWGDFSKDGRWADQNILLCRDESLVETRGVNFRELWDTDMYYWDLIDENMDMLGACPADTILW
ncbi:hypothetical protein V8E51_014758 [Hyaloscypha variabilis]